MRYIGIDYHNKNLQIAEVNEKGEIEKNFRISNDVYSVLKWLEKVPQDSQAVLESTYGWYPLYELLHESGIPTKVANPFKVRVIAEGKIKTDKIDAKVLAHLLRLDYLPECHVGGIDVLEDRRILRERIKWVQAQTGIKNRIRSILSFYKYKIGSVPSSLWSSKGIGWLKNLNLSPDANLCLKALLDALEELDKKIKVLDREINRMAVEDKNIQLLTTIPGFGAFIASLLWKELDGVDRFISFERLASYAGLVPSVHSSGGNTYYGRITKTGNSFIRWALVEAVMPACSSSVYFRNEYDRLKKTKNANTAKIALARKLLKIAYGVLKTKIPYDESVFLKKNIRLPSATL